MIAHSAGRRCSILHRNTDGPPPWSTLAPKYDCRRHHDGIVAGIPALLPRLPLHGVVLEIVLGVIIGPQVLGLVHPSLTLNFLANFGLGMLFLMAGFEMDPTVLRGRPIRNALTGGRSPW